MRHTSGMKRWEKHLGVEINTQHTYYDIRYFHTLITYVYIYMADTVSPCIFLPFSKPFGGIVYKILKPEFATLQVRVLTKGTRLRLLRQAGEESSTQRFLAKWMSGVIMLRH